MADGDIECRDRRGTGWGSPVATCATLPSGEWWLVTEAFSLAAVTLPGHDEHVPLRAWLAAFRG